MAKRPLPSLKQNKTKTNSADVAQICFFGYYNRFFFTSSSNDKAVVQILWNGMQHFNVANSFVVIVVVARSYRLFGVIWMCRRLWIYVSFCWLSFTFGGCTAFASMTLCSALYCFGSGFRCAADSDVKTRTDLWICRISAVIFGQWKFVAFYMVMCWRVAGRVAKKHNFNERWKT